MIIVATEDRPPLLEVNMPPEVRVVPSAGLAILQAVKRMRGKESVSRKPSAGIGL